MIRQVTFGFLISMMSSCQLLLLKHLTFHKLVTTALKPRSKTK